MSQQNQAELIKNSSTVTKKQDEVLLLRGDAVSGAYWVVRGELQVFTLSEEGRETVLYSISAGESCVFALNSVFNEIAYPAWVKVASDEVTIVVIDGPFFKRLFESEKVVRDWVWTVQSTRVIDLMCSIDELLNLSLESRLNNFLLRSMDNNGEVRKTHEIIARHVGSTREVVTRKLNELADNHIVTLTRGCVKLIDTDKLK